MSASQSDTGSVFGKVARFLPVWIASALVTTALGVLLQTQNVIARLNDLGAGIGFGDRISMSLYDLIHLGSVYVVFVGLGTLVAYLAAAFVYRLAGFGRPLVFAVAGGAAMLVMLILMKQAFFGIHLIAGARDGVGIALQMLAGVAGGLVFAALSERWARKRRVR